MSRGMQKIDLKDVTQVPGADTSAACAFADDQVGPGRRVTLHFELALPDGELVDSNFHGNAAQFTVGDGSLLPGFEEALFGLRAGDELSRDLPAAQAFGERRPENVQAFPRFRFPADLAMEGGLMINFADAAGNEQAGVITDFSADRVTVDFNHPLAGRTIRFRARIVAVTAPTATGNP